MGNAKGTEVGCVFSLFSLSLFLSFSLSFFLSRFRFLFLTPPPPPHPRTQVVLKAGEVLYIPSYWFHYIVSLGQSVQCNTRSGSAIRGRDKIKECGFY